MEYLSEIKKNQTTARVVAYSIAENSKTPLITFEYEAYRGILAELNTHSILCKNAESSRAVPVKNRIKQIRDKPYVPVYWGSNKPGMVAGEEIDAKVTIWEDGINNTTLSKDEAWGKTADIVASLMEDWDRSGYHKQIVNRIGEAFTTVKGVITGTEWDNFFHLRRAPDADPAIKELADCMWLAKEAVEREMTYTFLNPGEWHLPYVDLSVDYNMSAMEKALTELLLSGNVKPTRQELLLKVKGLTLEQALKISSAACGQVSFRKLDTSEETAERVWKRLMEGETIHASVTAHQGTPMETFKVGGNGCGFDLDAYDITKGMTHLELETGDFWSAQFKHWIMFRKTIPNEVCKKYTPKEE